ncbi:MAG: hypothetical protein LBG80_15665 [Bacteroidales bacterium]|jgi:DNA-binding CsgD family transcriptional regulator|nr:hypothetical protein [Bacteroidales bacterium]
MKQMDSTTPDFLPVSTLQTVSDEESSSIYTPEVLSMSENILSVCSEAGYIIDFQKRRFHCVSNHGLFLCGHTKEEAMQLDYKFYSYIVHKDDLRLLVRMYNAVINSPYITECPENIAHFSFTVRIKVYPDITDETKYQMVYHRLRPVFFNGKLCFGICMMNISVLKTSGNLSVYFEDNRDSFDEYSLKNQNWNTKQVIDLKNREILTVKFAKQGLNNKEIVGALGVKYETLRREITSICEKFNLGTIGQVIVYLTNHLMLFDTRRTSDTTKKRKGKSKKRCPKRKLTPEKLKYSQECLDNRQSNRETAKNVGVSEGCIRDAIDSGKLHKKRQ